MRKRSLAWLSLVACLALTACTSAPAATPPTHVKSVPTISDFLNAVTAATDGDQGGVAAGPEALSAAGLKDVDDTPKSAAQYQLTVYCAGNGDVSIALFIGTNENDATLTCRPDVATYYVSGAGPGDSSTVEIWPTSGGPVAVAYRLKSH